MPTFWSWERETSAYVSRWSFTRGTGTKSRHSIPSFPLKQVYHLRDFKAWITIENNRPRLNINYSKQRTTKGWERKCLGSETSSFSLARVLLGNNLSLRWSNLVGGLIESSELWKEKPGLHQEIYSQLVEGLYIVEREYSFDGWNLARCLSVGTLALPGRFLCSVQ